MMYTNSLHQDLPKNNISGFSITRSNCQLCWVTATLCCAEKD
jgi:hypothetical protein